MVKKKVCSFTLAEEAIEELDCLKYKLGLVSKADVVRSALRLANYLTKELRKGNRVVIIKKNGNESELVLV